jgi:hypothetical protein
MGRSIRRAGLSLAIAGTVAVGAASAFTAAGTGAAAHDGHAGHARHAGHAGLDHRDVQELRAATARFHNVKAAVASGRIDLDLCFDQMGAHYADPATFGDGILDPSAPEALVYEQRGRRLRLVAVEWVSTTPGEVRGVPLHLNEALGVYVLHAWVWANNPDGVLADFNPRVGDCPP